MDCDAKVFEVFVSKAQTAFVSRVFEVSESKVYEVSAKVSVPRVCVVTFEEIFLTHSDNWNILVLF